MPLLPIDKFPSVKFVIDKPLVFTNGFITGKLFSGESGILQSCAATLEDVQWWLLPLVSAPIVLAEPLPTLVLLNSNLYPFVPYEPAYFLAIQIPSLNSPNSSITYSVKPLVEFVLDVLLTAIPSKKLNSAKYPSK